MFGSVDGAFSEVVCDNVVSRPPQRKLEMWIRGIVYYEIFVKFFGELFAK